MKTLSSVELNNFFSLCYILFHLWFYWQKITFLRNSDTLVSNSSFSIKKIVCLFKFGIISFPGKVIVSLGQGSFICH